MKTFLVLSIFLLGSSFAAAADSSYCQDLQSESVAKGKVCVDSRNVVDAGDHEQRGQFKISTFDADGNEVFSGNYEGRSFEGAAGSTFETYSGKAGASVVFRYVNDTHELQHGDIAGELRLGDQTFDLIY